MDDCAEVEGDFELQVLEEVTEVAVSKWAHATKARLLAGECAVVEDVIVWKRFGADGRLGIRWGVGQRWFRVRACGCSPAVSCER